VLHARQHERLATAFSSVTTAGFDASVLRGNADQALLLDQRLVIELIELAAIE
jgi:hypothetical protein